MDLHLQQRRPISRRGIVPGGFLAACLSLLPAVLAEGPGEREGGYAGGGSSDDSEGLSHWIADLSADSFAARQLATQQLIELGADACKPVAAAMETNNPEVVIRGAYILRELALADESRSFQTAQAALEELARQGRGSAADRARATLSELYRLRQERAIAKLRRLGAKIEMAYIRIGMQFVDEALSITIDDRFRGDASELARLKWLSQVQQATFEGEQVQDEWIEHACAMPKLAVLNIKRASITNRALASLATVKDLRHAAVWYSPVDDAGVPSLEKLKEVQELQLYGTKVTREAADKLQDRLAATHVDYRRGAFLGVGCSSGNNGAMVTHVQPNTAAAVADIQAGDIIDQYNGKKVKDFEGLTDLISENAPEEVVAVTLNRDGVMIEKKIKLGAWK